MSSTLAEIEAALVAVDDMVVSALESLGQDGIAQVAASIGKLAQKWLEAAGATAPVAAAEVVTADAAAEAEADAKFGLPGQLPK